MACTVCSYVASVCPTAAITPCSVSSRTESRPPGSSVASVIIFAWPCAASTSLRTSAGSGSRSSCSSWAPLRHGEMNGPSKWMPAISPCWASSASIPACRARKSRSPVTAEATTVVVPCRRCVSTPRRTSSAVPPAKEAPPPPWLWRSTKPGTTQWPDTSTTSAPGGAVSAIRVPSTITRPSSTVPVGSTTRAPARTLLGAIRWLPPEESWSWGWCRPGRHRAGPGRAGRCRAGPRPAARRPGSRRCPRAPRGRSGAASGR